MATTEVKDIEFCPICRTLPLDAITFGVKGPALEFRLDDAAMIQLTSPDIEKQFSRKCALYHIARSLHRMWLGEETSTIHHHQCCKTGLDIITESNTLARRCAPWNARPVHPDPLSPLALVRLQEWAKFCDSKHTGCRVENPPLLPSRVIDVGGSSLSQSAKLVVTSDGQRASYIALSHCWGRSNPFITTKDNLEEMKTGFLVEKVPATFKDAITIARALGICYLWIDSLCIIQGDSEDWQIESSRMGAVYRNSTITLAAMDAASDAEGFLKTRPYTHWTLKFVSTKGETAEVYLQPKLPLHHWETSMDYGGRKYPLDTRAWCLQEAYLPKRVIKYFDNNTLWHCEEQEIMEAEHTAGHNGGLGNPSSLQNIMRNSTIKLRRTVLLVTPYQGWYRMVSEYTKRNLSHISDKLPAVSGLASLVAEHDSGKYCAGVWWEDMAFGICWKKSYKLSRTDDYTAPSWSWASVNGPVEFINANYHPYDHKIEISLMSQVTFHDFYSAKRGFDDYGQLDMAWVNLSAPIASINMSDKEILQISGIDSWETSELTFDFENERRESLMAMFLMWRLNGSSLDGSSGNQVDGTLGVIIFGLLVHAAPHLLQRCKEFGLQNDDDQIYERVGFFRLLTSKARASQVWGAMTATKIILA